MNLINTWNSIREIESLQNHLLRAINAPRAQSGTCQKPAKWSPAVDVSEDANQYLIKADLPELKKEDISVTVENGVLTLKGERAFAKEETGVTYHRIERTHGSFERRFNVPDDTDLDQISAEFRDGVLHLKLPKSEAQKPRQIEVLVN